MIEEKTFRKTNPVAVPADAPEHSDIDFAMLEPRDQLKSLLQAEMADKPFLSFPLYCSIIVALRLSGIFCWTRWKNPAIPWMISTPWAR